MTQTVDCEVCGEGYYLTDDGRSRAYICEVEYLERDTGLRGWATVCKRHTNAEVNETLRVEVVTSMIC